MDPVAASAVAGPGAALPRPIARLPLHGTWVAPIFGAHFAGTGKPELATGHCCHARMR